MSTAVDIISMAYPAFIALSFIMATLIIFYLVNILVKKYPQYKPWAYVGGTAIIIILIYPYFYFAYSFEALAYMTKALVSIPLIFFIPGCVLYKAFIKENIGLEPVEILLLWILGSVLISGWIGLILAEIGYFSLFNLLALLIILCCVLTVAFKIKFQIKQPEEISINRHMMPLALILLIVIALFFHPFPTVYGGRDQGVYVNTGVNIANAGSIVTYDKLFQSIDSRALSSFYTALNNQTYDGVLYPGIYVIDAKSGELSPQFFFLWPTWIAIFYSIFGLNMGLYVLPLFAILSVLSIYVAGKMLFNRNIGLTASLLLTLNFAIVWYARDHTSEIFTLFLILSMLYTLILFIRFTGQLGRLFGILSALCLGETFLTRIDTILLLMPVIAYFAYIWMTRRFKRKHLDYIVILSALGVHSIISAIFISAPYIYGLIGASGLHRVYPMLTLELPYLSGMFLLSIILLALLAILVIYKDQILGRITGLKAYGKFLPHLIALLFIAAIIYGYFIRPATDMSINGNNLIRLSWYMSGVIGIFLAGAGCILLLYKKPYVESYLFLSIFLIYAVLYSINPSVSLDQPWWVRRFVPVVIPFAIICISYFIGRVKSLKILGRWPVNAAALILIGLLIIPSLAADAAIISYVHYNGIISDVNGLSNVFGNDSIVLYNGYKGDYYISRISLPLQYIKRIDTLPVSISGPSMAQVDQWLLENKTVYLLDIVRSDDIYGNVVPVGYYNVSWTVLQNATWIPESYYYTPDGIETLNHTFTVVAIKNESDLDNIIWLTGNEWHNLEDWDGTPSRWENNNASIAFHSSVQKNISLSFCIGSFYKPRTLQVYLNDNSIYEAKVDTNYTNVTIPLKVPEGYNDIRFYSLEEPDAISDILENNDTRQVSFIFRNLSISLQ